MAVAKGATIPANRMLDAVEATAQALSVFDQWAGITSEQELPANEVDSMQIKLARWQNDRFGHVPTSDVHMALGVIEELGEGFDQDATAEDAVDALGDVVVYAAQLCTANRLAVRPVLELATLYVKRDQVYGQAICIAGMLAHVALKHAQNIRGLGPREAYRPRLVDALAMMIGKALEDCICAHELNVDPAGVFLVIGREVMERKQGDAMIPKAIEPEVTVRGATAAVNITATQQAYDKLYEAAGVLETPEAQAEGNVTAPTFLRLMSTTASEQCPVWSDSLQCWVESDEQLRERIIKQQADLSA